MLKQKEINGSKKLKKSEPILIEENNYHIKSKKYSKKKDSNAYDNQEEIKGSTVDYFETFADYDSKMLNEPIINQGHYQRAIESEKKTIDKSIDKMSIKLYQYSILKEAMNQCSSYPEKTRKYIWQFLLSLPNDQHLYNKYSSQGIHPFFRFINEMYPLKDKTYEEPMRRICSLIAYWSPQIANVYFLPNIVFPFVKSFLQEDHFVFEAIIAIINSICQYWFEFYPGAPLFHLKLAEKIIQREAGDIVSHIKKIQEMSGSSQLKMIEIIWRYLKNFFSENLVKEHWLQMFDFLITYNHKPEMILYFTCAYMLKIRSYILKGTDAQKLTDILFDINPNISLVKVFKKTLELYKTYSKYQLYKYTPHLPFAQNTYPTFQHFPKEFLQTTAMLKEEIFKTANAYDAKTKEIEQMESKFNATLKKEEEVQRKHLTQINAENEQEDIIRRDLDIILFHKNKYNDEITKNQINKISSLNTVLDKTIKIYDQLNDAKIRRTEQEMALKSEYEDILLNQKKINMESIKYDTTADRCLMELLNLRNKQQNEYHTDGYLDKHIKEREHEKAIHEDKWQLEEEERMKKISQIRNAKELELKCHQSETQHEIRKHLDKLTQYEQDLLIQQIEAERQDRNILINNDILKNHIENNTKDYNPITIVNSSKGNEKSKSNFKFTNELLEKERLRLEKKKEEV